MWVYLTLHALKELELLPRLFIFYGKDFITVPILVVSVKIVRDIFDLNFSIGKKEVIIAVLYLSIVFEWILPKFSMNFVSDIGDIVAYSLGGILYYMLFTPKSKNKKLSYESTN